MLKSPIYCAGRALTRWPGPKIERADHRHPRLYPRWRGQSLARGSDDRSRVNRTGEIRPWNSAFPRLPSLAFPRLPSHGGVRRSRRADQRQPYPISGRVAPCVRTLSTTSVAAFRPLNHVFQSQRVISPHLACICTNPRLVCTRPRLICTRPRLVCTDPRPSCTQPGCNCTRPRPSCTRLGHDCTSPSLSCTAPSLI